jgi:hypothetical protein
MPLKLTETTISGTSVKMRLEDEDQSREPNLWVEFEVPLSDLMLDANNPLGVPGRRPLAIVQRAALSRVQEAIYQEMKRLSDQLPR